MGPEVASKATRSKRWKAFLTYAHRDNAEVIKDFYEVFTRELAEIGSPDEFFLDDLQEDRGGEVKTYLENHAGRADFLIIFVGDHYPSREFCLHEWVAFRGQFDDHRQVRDRLFIIEIDKGALVKLKSADIKGQEKIAAARAEDLKACFHNTLLHDAGERIISRRDDGKLNQTFEQRVEGIARVFHNRYSPLSSGPEAPADAPAWMAANDVLIGPWTEDLKEAVGDLLETLRLRQKTCASLPGWSEIENTEPEMIEKMRVAVSGAKYFVQPYNIAQVRKIQPGRLAHFDFFKESRGARPLYYWRPDRSEANGAIAAQEIDRLWTGPQAWVGTRLKELEFCQTSTGAVRRSIMGQNGSAVTGGPRVLLGGIVEDQLGFGDREALKETLKASIMQSKFADGLRSFLKDFWTRQRSDINGSQDQGSFDVEIEINKVADFLKFSPERRRQYSGVVLLNQFSEKESLVAQMEEIQRRFEEDAGKCEFSVFLFVPPPDFTKVGTWNPIYFLLTGDIKDGFRAPTDEEFEPDKLKDFFTHVVAYHGR